MEKRETDWIVLHLLQSALHLDIGLDYDNRTMPRSHYKSIFSLCVTLRLKDEFRTGTSLPNTRLSQNLSCIEMLTRKIQTIRKPIE